MHGDATNLDASIPSDSFDISHSHQMLLHLPGDDPVKALKSIRRVVKPGGVLTTRDNHGRFIYPATPTLQRCLDMFPVLCSERGAHPDAGHANHVWMHEAGFEWEKIKFGDACKYFVTPKERQLYGQTFKWSFWKTFGKGPETEEEEKWLQEYQRDLEAWVKKPEARVGWVDGWVVATK